MTSNPLTEAMEQDKITAERHALDLVNAIAVLHAQLKPLEDTKKRAVDQLKQWMALEGLGELRDGEHGLVARLQDRKGTPVYDLVRLVKDDKIEALIDAAAAGMARIDHAMLARFRKDAGASWADTLAHYEMPGTGSTALIVEKEERQ